jgi:hypothetical protein
LSHIILIIFSNLLLGTTSFIRDMFALPFFGARIHFLNIFLYLPLLYFIIKNKLKFYGNNSKYLLDNLLIPKEFIIFFLATYLMSLGFLFKEKNDTFFISQILDFLMALFFLKNFIISNDIKIFLITINKMLYLFLIIFCFLSIINLLTINNSMNQLIQINYFPFIGFLIYLLSKNYNLKKEANISLLLTFLLACICLVKAIFIIIPLFYFLEWIIKKIRNKKLRRYFKFSVLFIFLVLPFALPYLVEFFLGISIININLMESNRYFLDDNISSLLSRIFSVTKIINSQNIFTLFGIDLSRENPYLTLGYPVHNLLLAMLIRNGIFGLFAAIALIINFIYLSKHNFFIALFGIICISYFNDFYSWFSLFFFPLFFVKFYKNRIFKKFSF